MARFPHLALPNRLKGLHKPKAGRSGEMDPITQGYLSDRRGHGTSLIGRVDSLSNYWQQNIQSRRENALPDLPDPNVVPVFLQIDASKFDIESLKSFGIEIIAEEENGFIIGASGSDFRSLREKINSFMTEEGLFKNKASQLWDINQGVQWRINQILSEDLRAKWDTITDDQQITVDIGIACYVRISNQPLKKRGETTEAYANRVNRWRERKDRQEQVRDEIAMERQTAFERLIEGYGGTVVGSFVDYDDSFACRITISGRGLKDIVLNYQYLFEVVEYEPLLLPDSAASEVPAINPTLSAPEQGAPKVCVIDSGIQEGHRLLAPAIDSTSSHSFVDGDATTADVAPGGGHGTKVAGAILYPHELPISGNYTLPFFIQNARVLTSFGGRTTLPMDLYPPKLMEDIVGHYEDTRIFNMSINSYNACRLVHMSQWAATIDKLMHERNILFVLSAGNLPSESNNPHTPGIRQHVRAGRNYPAFLLEPSSRVGNPAQSSFALTVGSVCIEKFDEDSRESFGAKDDPSSFSRTGLGLWGMIKPDVVEYAGDFVREKKDDPNITTSDSTSPRLLRSTAGGGSEVGSDSVGTSFAAPRVTKIAASLQKMYPEESVNLYRALIAQSARLPESAFGHPEIHHIQHYGYGIPDLQRATENSQSRITLITSDEIKAKEANVYSVKVPAEMRAPGEEYDVLVEVTLAFMSRPRRTRRGSHSYLSTWLDWHSSKLNENLAQFKQRVLKDIEESEVEESEDQNTIPWVIRENKEWSRVTGLRRQDSTLQKSWCVIKSHQLPEILSLAVVGHTGWEPDQSETVPYSMSVSFEALAADVNVYEMIRVENEIELPVEVEQEVEI